MLSVKNIIKSYNGKCVLHIENLKFYENEVTVIIGASGSGKTTLLNILGTLEPADSGSVNLLKDDEAIDIFTDIKRYRAKEVGFVFQDFNLIDGLSAVDNIKISGYYAGLRPSNICNILNDYKISNEKQNVSTLSGGEKQRVSLCRAITKNASIILADEPSGSLDSTNANKVFTSLRELRKNRHIIIVTHDELLAKKFADRIIRISDGKVVENYKNTASVEITENNELNRSISCILAKNTFALKCKSSMLLACNSIKRRLWKMLSIIIVIAISITALVSVIHLNFAGNKIADSVNKSYMETDLISVSYEQQAMEGVGEKPINMDSLNNLLKRFAMSAIVPSVQTGYYIYGNNKISTIIPKFIDITDFFRERLSVNTIIGEQPKNINEIVISETIAKELFNEEDCIGKTIQLTNGSGYAQNSIALTIVGINTTKNVNGEIYTFIPYQNTFVLQQKKLQAMKSIIIKKMQYEFQPGISTSNNTVEVNFREATANDSIQGKEPSFNQERTEIVVSSAILEEMSQKFSIALNPADSSATIEQINKQDLGFVYNGVHKIQITGVFASNQKEVLMHKDIIDTLQTPLPTSVSVYITNTNQSKEITEYINKNGDGLLAISQYQQLQMNVSIGSRFFQYALIVLGILLAMISFFMLHSLIKLTMHERVKEIAILKSLGATNLNVSLTLLLDILFITLSSVILSMVFVLIVSLILPVVFEGYKLFVYTYPILPILLIGLSYIILSILFALLASRKAIHTPPSILMKK